MPVQFAKFAESWNIFPWCFKSYFCLPLFLFVPFHYVLNSFMSITAVPHVWSLSLFLSLTLGIFHVLWSSSTWQVLSTASRSQLKHFTSMCQLLSSGFSFSWWLIWITGFYDCEFPIMLSCCCHLLCEYVHGGVKSGWGLAGMDPVDVLWVISPGYPLWCCMCVSVCPCATDTNRPHIQYY